MKYQCVGCGKIIEEDKAITVGINTGWAFYTSTIFCNDCFELYEKSTESCVECKYRKNSTKFLRLTEPCKSCKNHSNWEDK